jgi:glycosyltransferase involved in cell wall biosynthesis
VARVRAPALARRSPLTSGVRVLIANHTSLVSGAERALLDLVAEPPPGASIEVACPEGDLAERLRESGVRVMPLRGSAGSFKLHPVHTPLAAAELAVDALRLRRLAGGRRFDIVHANSVRSGLSAVAAQAAGGAAAVVQVHDYLPDGAVADGIRRVLGHARLLLANSRATATTLGPRLAAEVVYNPLDLDRFDPARVDRDAARRSLGLGPDTPVAGVVAQITPWKGQAVAIDALARARERVPDAQLLLVGETKFTSAATRFDNRSYLRELEASVERLGLAGAVRFLGEREDVPAVLRALDAVLVPSSHEPFGRIVAEALAMGTPVLATSVGGPAEILEHGRTGLLLDPHDPGAWSEALAELLTSPELRARLAGAGRERALDFSRRAYAERLGELWRRAAEQSPDL